MKVLRSLLLVLVCPSLVYAAQQNVARPRAAAPTGFRAEFLANLDEVQEKIMMLAEATPDARFSFRPPGDVRSTSEVFMHIVGGNYFLATFIGVKAPNGLAPDMEKKVTKKQDVVAELRRSFDHLRNAVAGVSDAELEKSVKMFGNQTTYRGVMITMLAHLHEHLGQSIAYARMNGVVPPWSR